MPVTAIHLTIHGRVQGVGYRAWAKRSAISYDLRGWVRNRADGSVEMVIAGTPEAVAAMREACARGPLRSKVDRIDALPWDGEVPTTFEQLETV